MEAASRVQAASFEDLDTGPCPLCSNARSVVVLRSGSKSWKKCAHCGVRYVAPWPTREELLAYFSSPCEMKPENLEIRYHRCRHRILSRIGAYIDRQKSRGRILDVGCAVGYFLGQFFQKPGWERWGVELSAPLADHAARKGIEVHAGDIRSAGFTAGFFDVVTVLDAFYYFPEPHRELEEIRRVLKPDGLLVMDFPMAQSHMLRTSPWGRLLTGRGPAEMNGVHQFLYDPPSISHALSDCRFQVQRIFPLPANEPEKPSQRMLYRGYSLLSAGLWSISRSTLMLGPRFLVSASPKPQ